MLTSFSQRKLENKTIYTGVVLYIFLNMDECVKIPAVFPNYRKYQWAKNQTVEKNVRNGKALPENR